ncbi:beta-glucanase [Spirochaeta dissipatitropha]
MKHKNSVAGIMLIGIVSVFFSCDLDRTAAISGVTSIESEYTFTFHSHNDALFEIADGWSNGGFFDATWRKEQVSFDTENAVLTLTLDHDVPGSSPQYKSGEYRSRNFYSYGLYEVKMKAAKGDGLVSSFFIYTGPSDNNPWDEIDIEILGKDTRVMQTNYFTNGVGGKEVYIDLGFDASEDFNEYAFEWLPDEINWFVNGELVHTEDGSKGKIPDTPAKIMVNLWPGTGVDAWTGSFDDSVLPVTAEYAYIKYTAYSSDGIRPLQDRTNGERYE